METVTYSFATRKDQRSIKSLLSESKLPIEDINKHIFNFIVAKRLGLVVGCIGLEHLEQYGLLRSLVVNTVLEVME